MFKGDMFRFNFYGGDLTDSVFAQVRSTMLVTVFVFLGIEGASVYSRYAQKREDVGFATVSGFFIVTTLMVLVTLLPYAVLERSQIAGMRQPSMAMVLEAVVGPWGAIFVSVGLLVSVLGAYLAWSLICAEVLFAAAKAGDMPRVFATENRNAVPAAALWLTNVIVQLLLISTLFSNDAFTLMLNLTSAMSLIPYLFVALYGVKLAARGETYGATGGRNRDLVIAGVATAYTAFMLLAGGLKFLLLSATLYAPGTLLYVWTRREQARRVFSPIDLAIFALAVLGAIGGVYGLVTGAITI
jgi:arginine:ornithine antiporter/lysine permease